MNEINLDLEPNQAPTVFEKEETAMTVVRDHEPESATLWGSAAPVEIIQRAAEYATALVKVVDSRKLFTMIQGRKHVRIEGWTLLGSMLGAFSVVEWVKPLGPSVDGLTPGFEARVQVFRKGQLIGAAEARCTRAEANWATKDDYALESMAQTRAAAKGFRLPLGFIMVLGGYEPCPAEEMDGEIVASAAPQEPSTPLAPAVQEMLDKAQANREREQGELDKRKAVDKAALKAAGFHVEDPEISGNCEGCGAQLVKHGPIKKAGKYTGRYFMTCPNDKDKSVRHTWRAI